MSSPQHRRRRRRPASAPASQYPGFFVLSQPPSRSASLRWGLLALLGLVVFVAGLALFFRQTAEISDPRAETPFVIQSNRFDWK